MLFGVIDDKCKDPLGEFKDTSVLLNEFYTCMTGSSECDDLLVKLRSNFTSDKSVKPGTSGSLALGASGSGSRASVPPASPSPADFEGAGGADYDKFYEDIIGKYGEEYKESAEVRKSEEWVKVAKDFAAKYYRYEKIIFIFVDYFVENKKSCRDIFSDMTFNVIDNDKSGIIGLKEYRNYVKTLSGTSYSSLRADSEFKMFDTDKSNAIDIQEFREIFKIAVYGFSDADPVFIFGQIDVDNDGKITYDEFMAYFKRVYPDYKKATLVNDFKKVTEEDSKREVPVIRRSIGFEQFKSFYEEKFGSNEEDEKKKKKNPADPAEEDEAKPPKGDGDDAPADVKDNAANDDDGKDEA